MFILSQTFGFSCENFLVFRCWQLNLKMFKLSAEQTQHICWPTVRDLCTERRHDAQSRGSLRPVIGARPASHRCPVGSSTPQCLSRARASCWIFHWVLDREVITSSFQKCDNTSGRTFQVQVTSLPWFPRGLLITSP